MVYYMKRGEEGAKIRKMALNSGSMMFTDVRLVSGVH